jgi:hypothetical protein
VKKILLLLLFAAVALYAYWPYHTANKLEAALRSADKDALERLIDFPAVRQSLKEQMKAKMASEVSPSAMQNPGGNAVQAKYVSAMLTGAVADKVIDALVTAESIVRFLKLEKAVSSGAAMTLQNKTWHTPAEFSARAGDNTRFRFRFTGIDGWRVISVEPGDKLGNQAQIPR